MQNLHLLRPLDAKAGRVNRAVVINCARSRPASGNAFPLTGRRGGAGPALIRPIRSDFGPKSPGDLALRRRMGDWLRAVAAAVVRY